MITIDAWESFDTVRDRIRLGDADAEQVFHDEVAEGRHLYLDVDLYDPDSLDAEVYEHARMQFFFEPTRAGWQWAYRAARCALALHDLTAGDSAPYAEPASEVYARLRREEDRLVARDDCLLIRLLWSLGFDVSLEDMQEWLGLQWDGVARWVWAEACRCNDLPTEGPSRLPHCLAGRRQIEPTITAVELLAEAIALRGYRADLAGVPRVLRHDNGPAYSSAPVRAIVDALGVSHGS